TRRSTACGAGVPETSLKRSHQDESSYGEPGTFKRRRPFPETPAGAVTAKQTRGDDSRTWRAIARMESATHCALPRRAFRETLFGAFLDSQKTVVHRSRGPR